MAATAAVPTATPVVEAATAEVVAQAEVVMEVVAADVVATKPT